MSDPIFNNGNDLTTPAGLIAECESLAGGMRQQQIAARSSSALGGHPNPEYLYAQAEVVLLAAARMLAPLVPPPAPTEPVVDAPAIAPPFPGAVTAVPPPNPAVGNVPTVPPGARPMASEPVPTLGKGGRR